MAWRCDWGYGLVDSRMSEKIWRQFAGMPVIGGIALSKVAPT